MRILNFGSLNLDYTYQVAHIVLQGETITSSGLAIHPGGKGLNQSIALARAGAAVSHAGQIGEDGAMLKEICAQNGVDTTFIETVPTRSGNAIIQVDEHGQNSIILFPGANRAITRPMVDKVFETFGKEDCLLVQNEISCLPYIIDKACEKGLKIIMNPSPMDSRIYECDLTKVSMFILNEVEGAQMTGKKEASDILDRMRDLFPDAEVVLTLGSEGSVYCSQDILLRQEIFPAEVRDTTGAGDTFTGFFIAEYLESRDPKKALETASRAASIAVSREGAAGSVPTMKEVKSWHKEV